MRRRGPSAGGHEVKKSLLLCIIVLALRLALRVSLSLQSYKAVSSVGSCATVGAFRSSSFDVCFARVAERSELAMQAMPGVRVAASWTMP